MGKRKQDIIVSGVYESQPTVAGGVSFTVDVVRRGPKIVHEVDRQMIVVLSPKDIAEILKAVPPLRLAPTQKDALKIIMDAVHLFQGDTSNDG